MPKNHGKSRVDDWWVLSGIVFVNRNALRCRDAPSVQGQPCVVAAFLPMLQTRTDATSIAMT